jgi:hypothetical protein
MASSSNASCPLRNRTQLAAGALSAQHLKLLAAGAPSNIKLDEAQEEEHVDASDKAPGLFGNAAAARRAQANQHQVPAHVRQLEGTCLHKPSAHLQMSCMQQSRQHLSA